LCFDDFKDDIGYYGAEYGGATTCYIEPFFDYVDGTMRFGLFSVFSKQNSAIVRDSSYLIHEQGHFDICEIMTRRARQFLAKIKYDKINEKAVYEAAHDYNGRLKEMHKKYDSETDNGLLQSKQKEWNEKIKKMLFALRAYEKD
jgi:hypothetical protein